MLLIGGTLSLALLFAEARAAAAPSEPVCRRTEAARALDFWVGDWDVYVAGRPAGRDRVVRELDGCALTELWFEDPAAGANAQPDGKSLFAFDAREELWRQVWITRDSSQPGGVKFKALRRRSAGSTVFQGEITGKSGAIFYDRTTLDRNADGSVRQLIEVSRDGADWKAVFDALYIPHGARWPR